VVDHYLSTQDGVITSVQARAAGLSQAAVARRVRSGSWRRCGKGVYHAASHSYTDEARIRTSVLSYGALAAASGLTAAWWHGLTRFAPDIVEVTVPRNSHGRKHTATVVRRRDLPKADVVVLRRLRVTALPLTALEAAIRRREGARILDTTLQRHTELSDLWRAHLRNKGRYGSPAARRLLQAASDGARSAAERLLVKILREAGITGWKTNHPVGGYKVDVGFPRQKIALETDGFAFHSSPLDFQIDRERQNNLALLGWQVLRFTWLDLTEYPDRVIAVIRAAISAR
jgi:very-short-patch-repair endonuclease